MAANSKMKDYLLYAVGLAWLIKQWLNNTKLQRKGIVDDHRGRKGKEKRYSTYQQDSRKLMRICFRHNPFSNEAFLAYFFGAVLLLRTWLSMFVADIDGFMVKSLINKDKAQILVGIGMWLGIALPSAAANALIKYLQSRLALNCRRRLTEHCRELYFKNQTFFRVSHLDKSVPNPEHALTDDIAQWSDRYAELLSTIGKPLVDLGFFSAMLFKNLGFMNQFLASVVVWESGQALKYIRPNYAYIVSEKGNLEATLRFQHTRVIGASEEIAFCHGEAREQDVLARCFNKIVAFSKKTLQRAIAYTTMEEFTTKYFWSTVGLIQVAIPLLQRGTSAGENAKYFITTRRHMVRNADATERLMQGIKEIAEFSGYTKRVSEMIAGFEKIAATPLDADADITESDGIVMKNVPIITPTDDTIVKDVDLSIAPGDRLLVLGPNGCGKSSLFRILCGLWPLAAGKIQKPGNRRDIFFLPQRPYLVIGTFRDQILYPDSVEDMRAAGKTDEDLNAILEKVLMTGVCAAHGGLESVKEWGECLSGGEKQRLGLARVLYHNPKFAVLDECSSAINVDAEQQIFQHLVDSGMGLITITHRQTLFKFHTKALTFDGEGSYIFTEELQANSLDDLIKKKGEVTEKLQGVLRELGEDWPKTFEAATSTN